MYTMVRPEYLLLLWQQLLKVAGFIAFIRLFRGCFADLQGQWQLICCDNYSAATLFIGNITAVFQRSVKRMLAYSSIAQAGLYDVCHCDALNGIAIEELVILCCGLLFSDDRNVCYFDTNERLYV